ncbi:MAG: hypothetical protein ACT4TC_26895, partial [Myxococcaceae bacterium]
ATEAKEAEVRATARSAPLVTATRWIRDLTRDVRARRLEKEENISFWDRLLQAGWINRTWKLILALYAALAVVEWSILALSRDYQDQVMRNLSVVTGTPPDDPEVNPRIRIDFRWLRRRFKRRIRGLYLFFMGSIPLGMFGWLPGPSEQLASAAIALWAGYWLAVFTLAKTRLAWDDSETREPWYVRAYARSVGVVPGLGWYGRAMRRLGGSVRAPCQTFEMAGYEAAGLAVSRLLLGWPGLYSFVRPVFTVAAQHVCLARPRLAQSPPSVPAPASVGRAPSRG